MATGIKTGGRVKGTPNKTTRALKDAVLSAFDTVGAEDYLVTVAREDPRTFCALLGKVLPMQLTGEDGGPIRTEEVDARHVLASRVAELTARSGQTESDRKPH
jgi:hypothetical protein